MAKSSEKTKNKKKGMQTFTLSPFARDDMTTADCMFLTIIALLPSLGFGVAAFGFHALLLVLTAIVGAVASEAVFDLVTRKKLTIGDYSAALSGMILGLILPPRVPLWYALLGSAFGIIAGKMIFGGIGKNFLNPAGTGKLLLVILFHSAMVNFSGTGYGDMTPLALLDAGDEVSLGSLLAGTAPGCIGMTSAIAVLVGAIFLMLTGVVDITLSLSYLVGFAVIYIFFGRHGLSAYYLGVQLCGGGTLFTAFFMANDFTTTPVTRKGRVIYGGLMGILTCILRLLGARENAALYALLTVNVTARVLDAKLIPSPFGTRQVRRSIRYRAKTADEIAQEEAQGKSEEQLEAEQSEADLQEFEDQVLPANAANGSETKGTIGQSAVERNERRVRLDAGSLPQMPVFGETQEQYEMRSQQAYLQQQMEQMQEESAPQQAPAPQPGPAPAQQPYMQQPGAGNNYYPGWGNYGPGTGAGQGQPYYYSPSFQGGYYQGQVPQGPAAGQPYYYDPYYYYGQQQNWGYVPQDTGYMPYYNQNIPYPQQPAPAGGQGFQGYPQGYPGPVPTIQAQPQVKGKTADQIREEEEQRAREEEEARKAKRLSPRQMERHLKQKRKELQKAAAEKPKEKEFIPLEAAAPQDTAIIDVEEILKAEAELKAEEAKKKDGDAPSDNS